MALILQSSPFSEMKPCASNKAILIRLMVILLLLYLVRATADLLSVCGYLSSVALEYIVIGGDLCVCAIVTYHLFLSARERYLIAMLVFGCALVVFRSMLRGIPSAGEWVGINAGQVVLLANGILSNGGMLLLAGALCIVLIKLRDTVQNLRDERSRLHESEERFRQFFEFAPDPCFISDLNGVFVDGNRAAELLIGYPLAELRGKNFLELEIIHPDSLPHVLEVMTENSQGRDSGPSDFQIRRRDGTFVTVEVRAHPVTLRGERVVLNIARDVTQRTLDKQLKRVQVYMLECLTSGKPLSEIINGVTREVERIDPGTHCSLLLVDDNHRRLRLAAGPTLPDFYNSAVDGIEIADGVGCCGTAAFTGKRTIASDIASDPRWTAFWDVAKHANLASCWSEPILSSNGSVLGTFAIYRCTPGDPSEADLRLVETAAHFMSISIERTRSEEALRASEALYHSLVENLPQNILRKDMDGRFTFANQRFCESVNRTWAEIKGKTDSDLFPAELAEKYRNDDRSVIESGNPLSLVEAHITGDHGKVFVEVVKTPLRDAHGRITGIQGIFWDVTERKLAEEARRESEERFSQFMNNLPGLAFIKNRDLRYLYVNPQFESLLGLRRADWLGKLNSDLMPPQIAEVLTSTDLAVFDSNASHQFETEVSGRWWLSSKFPIGSSGSGTLLGGIAIDITDRKNAERERQEMERRMQHVQKLESLGVLAGGIAHDFNNLLLVVLGNADLALSELAPMSPARSSVKEIELAARRAAELCRQMLAYSGKGKFVIEQISLTELVTEMVHLLKASISKKAALNLCLEEGLPAMEGDPTQIRQVLMNLITNASEAIGDQGGVLTVATGVTHCSREYLQELTLEKDLPAGSYLFLEVSDTGCGMSEEIQKRIFEPFFTTKFTGRGLGMAAVLGIVHGHNGAIQFKSESGTGTTFRVLFPALDVAIVPKAGEDSGARVAWKGSGLVLLVDDEPTILTLATHMLERLGFSVLTAVDGRDALNVFKSNSGAISLVLLDLTMPNMDGEETFLAVREVQSDIPVIMTSGYTEHEIASRFAGKGIDGFIQKPYTLDVLRDCIKRATEKTS